MTEANLSKEQQIGAQHPAVTGQRPPPLHRLAVQFFKHNQMQLVRIHVVSESYRLLVLLLSPSIPSHDHKIYLPIPYGLLFQSLNLFILCASLGEITWHLTFCV